ncbi:amidohydrolase [Pseudoalteromonas luteoviolacea]|uniref:amidohydrolase family protein n=1 Tax=Pseudoalteromonas luteoviolacea TaxID=43657 RepID=UPI001F185EEE|nr:amidohydrolase family protein [Pseudoalteromonas luteoviolacea]MCF6439363.1 amidohydrolase [Pseudoalteromonas luteoviolacea]
MFKIIDCDRHVIEPQHLWDVYSDNVHSNGVTLDFDNEEKRTQRIKAGYPDLALPPVYKVQGYPILSNWDLEQQIASAIVNSQSLKERKSATNPMDQVESMQETNISKALLFPTFANYVVNHEKIDATYSLACAKNYNAWLKDYCSEYPEKLYPVGLLSRHDTNTLVEQVNEIVRFGWKAVVLRPEPILGKNLGHPDYEAFWDACESNDLTVCFHGGTHLQGQTVGMDRFTSRFSLHACSHPMEAQMAFITLLESGVLERYPRLKIAFLEAGCSWVAHWLWRLDNICYEEFPSLTDKNIKMKPSEYFVRNCWVGIEIGEPLSDVLSFIGHEKLIFGSDYPHPDHLHFDLTKISEKLPDLSESQLRDVLENNPKKLFGF